MGYIKNNYLTKWDDNSKLNINGEQIPNYSGKSSDDKMEKSQDAGFSKQQAEAVPNDVLTNDPKNADIVTNDTSPENLEKIKLGDPTASVEAGSKFTVSPDLAEKLGYSKDEVKDLEEEIKEKGTKFIIDGQDQNANKNLADISDEEKSQFFAGARNNLNGQRLLKENTKLTGVGQGIVSFLGSLVGAGGAVNHALAKRNLEKNTANFEKEQQEKMLENEKQSNFAKELEKVKNTPTIPKLTDKVIGVQGEIKEQGVVPIQPPTEKQVNEQKEPESDDIKEPKDYDANKEIGEDENMSKKIGDFNSEVEPIKNEDQLKWARKQLNNMNNSHRDFDGNFISKKHKERYVKLNGEIAKYLKNSKVDTSGNLGKIEKHLEEVNKHSHWIKPEGSDGIITGVSPENFDDIHKKIGAKTYEVGYGSVEGKPLSKGKKVSGEEISTHQGFDHYDKMKTNEKGLIEGVEPIASSASNKTPTIHSVEALVNGEWKQVKDKEGKVHHTADNFSKIHEQYNAPEYKVVRQSKVINHKKGVTWDILKGEDFAKHKGFNLRGTIGDYDK